MTCGSLHPEANGWNRLFLDKMFQIMYFLRLPFFDVQVQCSIKIVMVYGDISLMPIFFGVCWWGGVKWECSHRKCEFSPSISISSVWSSILALHIEIYTASLGSPGDSTFLVADVAIIHLYFTKHGSTKLNKVIIHVAAWLLNFGHLLYKLSQLWWAGHFCPKIIMYEKFKMPEFYVGLIFAQKIIKVNSRITRKINKFPNFSWYLPINAQILYDNCPKNIFPNFYFGGGSGTCPPAPSLVRLRIILIRITND